MPRHKDEELDQDVEVGSTPPKGLPTPKGAGEKPPVKDESKPNLDADAEYKAECDRLDKRYKHAIGAICQGTKTLVDSGVPSGEAYKIARELYADCCQRQSPARSV